METETMGKSKPQESAGGSVAPQARLRQLEEVIRHHGEEKINTPACTCWMTPVAKLDAALYACLETPGTTEERVALLEEAIRANRHGKKDVGDCPCWGNAPQMVDADLFAVLDRP
jgi:hypothetical protein